MSQKKRVKRPEIPRAEPRRSVAGAFGDTKSEAEPAAAAKNGAHAANGASTNGAHAANGASTNGAGGPGWAEARDASYEAINNGYRVIDEYMRQGQRLAEEFWLPSPDAKGVGTEFSRMMDRFLRSAGDMGSAWLEMMTQWTQAPARDAGGPRGTAGPFSAGSAGAAPPYAASVPGAPPLSITVESSKKVRLSVDARALVPGVEVHALVSAAPEAKPITTARLVQDPAGGLSLEVVVPDDQPAGAYHGVLVDPRTQRPTGTLTLTVR